MTSTDLIYRCLMCDHPRTDPDKPCELCGAEPALHVVEGPGTDIPPRLRALVAADVAARLREIAAWHRRRAALWSRRDAWHTRAQMHHHATVLERIADYELRAGETR